MVEGRRIFLFAGTCFCFAALDTFSWLCWSAACCRQRFQTFRSGVSRVQSEVQGRIQRPRKMMKGVLARNAQIRLRNRTPIAKPWTFPGCQLGRHWSRGLLVTAGILLLYVCMPDSGQKEGGLLFQRVNRRLLSFRPVCPLADWAREGAVGRG